MPDREKTIKRLEHLSEWLFHLYQVVCDGDAPDYYDAYKTVDEALALLKEQEAEQPIVHENSYGWKFYYCPKCKQEFYQNRKQAYCDKCGKAVKWE